MDINSKIYIAGHTGMVGSALVRKLKSSGYSKLLLRTHTELDLLDQKAVQSFFKSEKPEYVFIAAAKVGGIHANNTLRAQFLYENLTIQNNIIHFSFLNEVKKLQFLGSACIYPRLCPQPILEEYLLTDKLEPTNEPYAIAKIAGIKLCENYYHQYGANYISVMPNNLYGINDNFDLKSSHVLPALMRKFHEAKQNNSDTVELWGTGAPKREFLYVDDLADACVFLMNNMDAEELYNKGIPHINVGSSEEVTINELAYLIKNLVYFKGDIIFNRDYPDGMPRKLLDITRLSKLGWSSTINLEEGLEITYDWYKDNLT